MAVAPRIYEQQTETRVMPLPEQQGPAPGAIIADAVGALGGAAQRFVAERDQQQLASARSDRAVAFAEMQARVGQRVQELRSTAGPGGAGHEEAVAKLIDEETEGFMGTLGDQRLALDFKDDVARWRVGTLTSEQGFAIEQRATKQVSDHQAYSDLTANNLLTRPNGDDLAVAYDLSDKRIAAYAIPDAEKEKLRRADRSLFARSFLQGTAPEQRLQILRNGTFNADLDPRTTEMLIGGAEADIRQAAAAARSQASLARQEARDQVEGIARLVRDGVPLPDGDIATAQSVAKSVGLDALDYELGTALVRNRLTRETTAWLPADYDNQLVTLNAAIAKGGEKPDPALIIERDHIEKLRGQRVAQLREHPVEWLASVGRPLAPIDIANPDPDAITSRSRTMRALSVQTGQPLRLLTDAEAAPLTEAIAHGNGQERLQAAMTIGRFGADAEAVLRQVAGNDDGFKVAARLGTLPEPSIAQAAMRDALAGPDNLKVNPNVYDRASAERIFGEETGAALASLPASYRSGLFETARNIYATRMTRRGQSKWDADGFKSAIGDAIGGYWKNGRYLGGISERKGSAVLLPTGMASDEFERRLARANAAELVSGANGAPVWSGGRTVYSDEIKGLKPVSVGDGVYAFKVGNGFLTLKDGRTPYRLDIRKVGGGAR